MAPQKFVPAPEFFSDPHGICGSVMAKKAGIRYAEPPDDSDLMPLVVSGSPPAPSKAKLLFGHQVSKANAKHHGASTQFYSATADLQIQLKAETTECNQPGVESVEFDLACISFGRTRSEVCYSWCLIGMLIQSLSANLSSKFSRAQQLPPSARSARPLVQASISVKLGT